MAFTFVIVQFNIYLVDTVLQYIWDKHACSDAGHDVASVR
jgi:hypothetical protein